MAIIGTFITVLSVKSCKMKYERLFDANKSITKDYKTSRRIQRNATKKEYWDKK